MKEMIRFFGNDVKRINHLIKVYGYAKTIAELERIESNVQEIIEIAALTHDIGIVKSEEKYNSTSGYYQQIEGPDEARILFEKVGIEESIVERVCWLIAHHHTYTGIHAMDYQILIEADFLVNAWEDHMDKEVIQRTKKNIFKTEIGIYLLDTIYGLREDSL